MEARTKGGSSKKNFFTSRGEKMLSLVPRSGCGSSDELSDNEEWDEEQLQAGIRQLFEEIGFVDFENDSGRAGNPDKNRAESPGHNNPEPTMTEDSVNVPEEPVAGPSLTSPSGPNSLAGTPSVSTRAKKRASSSAPQRKKKDASTPKKRIKTKPLKLKWRKGKFQGCVTIPSRPMARDFPDVPQIQTALSYFYKFFSQECIDLIVEQTNLYSFQLTGESIKVDRNAIKAFLGIELYMGIIQLPAVTDYWSKRFRQSLIADVMSLKKFQKIRRFIHFADNSQQNEDPFYKIRPIVEVIRRNCHQIPPEGKYSVDEMMVPYKGTRAGSRKQYMPKKPCKWGFKIFVRAGTSGMVYDILLYSGSSTFLGISFTPEEDAMSFSAKVVIALCKSIPDPPLSTVYCDNFFTSIPLLNYLREELGILGLGTIRANRIADAPITPASEVKDKPRGWFEEVADNEKKIVIVQWVDSKPVLLASTYVSVDPVGSIKRWSKAQGARVAEACPQIITEYNAQMGGVDLCDMLIALFRTPLRSHRWYLTIFSQLMDICVVNAWLLYRRHTKSQPTKAGRNQEKGPKEGTGPKCGEASGLGQNDDQKEQDKTEGDEDLGGSEQKQHQKKHRNKRSEKKQKKPQSQCHDLPLKEFRADIAEGLKQSAFNSGSKKGTSPYIREKKKIVQPSSHDASVKDAEHVPIFTKKGKCRLCKYNQTCIYCAKCDKRLCMVPTRNCYFDFHCAVE